ncbi:DUF3108 domain-containing protein [Maribrevibacterium harenarium]|uniref:DUF3108 domain-containing protein n=1 Tax=Maribrevibacterium harenarium TaxID=2589817 RepID=A0A501WH52_9GAMM|nr:DUF3108 domain-containing protein [Maribrevibacterium harenarium]TPE48899.1 DUF3108 domain-containing protein [Maribrevibacterium harenarium]
MRAINQGKTYRPTLIAILLAAGTLFFSSAEAESNLAPFSATYSTTWHKGISLRVEGKQTLTKQAPNTWHFEFKASALIASLKEDVTFTLPDALDSPIKPLRYAYKSSVLGRKREAIITFDWDNMRVLNDVDDTPWYMEVENGTLDRLGLQLQLRRDLQLGKEELSYDVADGGKVKHWQFKRQGSDRIQTKLGKLDAIKVIRTDNQSEERLSTFWFAPKYDYLLVKMVHKEDGESYKLELEKIRQ